MKSNIIWIVILWYNLFANFIVQKRHNVSYKRDLLLIERKLQTMAKIKISVTCLHFHKFIQTDSFLMNTLLSLLPVGLDNR